MCRAVELLHHRMQPEDYKLSLREISERAIHTPLASPLPATQSNTQRGLLELVPENQTSPLERWNAGRERGAEGCVLLS